MRYTLKLFSFVSLAILVLSIVMVQAQTPSARTNASNRGAFNSSEFHSSNLLARAHPPRGAGFALMPFSSNDAPSTAAFTFTPLAAGNLPVQGSGTLGRLTKWTGFTTSNSSVGDSTIFEDKNGKVGIGTDSPTSRLTVMGLIESINLGGGFKFPDGTIQTTSAAGSLFGVAHDATLTGNGTAGLPLGVTVPLILTGTGDPRVIVATNGGVSVQGKSEGFGVAASGGDTSGDQFRRGGLGVDARGGNSSSSAGGGQGLQAFGGNSMSGSGGDGMSADGGNSDSGDGGRGANVRGGAGSGAGNRGGKGIVAFSGPGLNGAADGLAGFFVGDVEVTGNLSKGGGSFKIDHPLDPENKYLYHSFVESPDMKNIYDGNVTTDANGDATVTLPDWFDALNKDFRYQLTVIGTFAQAIVAGKVKDNCFTIKTNAPNVEVSWQVTGIRQDAYANKNRIKAEEDKTERERGYYLHPEAFNQPEELGIEWARNPELMKQMKEQREQMKQKRSQQ